MPHYRVTGFIRIEGDPDEDDDYEIWSRWVDLVVEADCGDEARLEAGYKAIEAGLLRLPSGCSLESWQFCDDEVERLTAVELMPAETEWHVRQQEDAVAYEQMREHGCGSLFGGLVKCAPA